MNTLYAYEMANLARLSNLTLTITDKQNLLVQDSKNTNLTAVRVAYHGGDAEGEVLSTVQHDQLHQLGGTLNLSGTAECACFKRELFKTCWKGLHEVLVCCHDSPVVFLVCLQTKLETPHSIFQALSCACSLSWRVWVVPSFFKGGLARIQLGLLNGLVLLQTPQNRRLI